MIRSPCNVSAMSLRDVCGISRANTPKVSTAACRTNGSLSSTDPTQAARTDDCRDKQHKNRKTQQSGRGRVKGTTHNINTCTHMNGGRAALHPPHRCSLQSHPILKLYQQYPDRHVGRPTHLDACHANAQAADNVVHLSQQKQATSTVHVRTVIFRT